MKLGDFTKTTVFGVAGLLGAVTGAVIYNLVVPPLPKAPPSPKAIEVCLLIDCSASMMDKAGGSQSKFDEVKAAAKVFVDENASKGQIAIVGFGDQAATAATLTDDAVRLRTAIDGLQIMGSTAMDAGLKAADGQFSRRSDYKRFIFLFTDGLPDSKDATMDAAKQIQSPQAQAVEIVTVGTGGADLTFLTALSGKPSISAKGGKFDVAFKEAGKVIYSKGIGSSEATTATAARRTIQASALGALIALGMALALIFAQNRYLHKPPISLSQAGLAIPGSLAAGALAGVVGQGLFDLAHEMTSNSLLELAGRVTSWTLLGAVLAWGMSFLVPNLKSTRAVVGGAIGGFAGSVGFLQTAKLGDWLGCIVGAAILGFAVGLMVALVEAMFREVWLEIRYGPKELRNVSLGGEPVTLGSDQAACTVYAANAAPIAYRYWVKDSLIFCQDVPASRTVNVVAGDKKQVGSVLATVCGSGNAIEPRKAGGAERPVGSANKGFVLRLANGHAIDLSHNASLSVSDLPGLHSVPPGGPVAKVNSHPTDATILGLQNLSHLPWGVKLANGDSIQVKPGKSVRLASGTRVNFGPIEGTIEL